MKGTDRLVELWHRHPRWPKLVVVQHKTGGDTGGDRPALIHAPNVHRISGYLHDMSLRGLQNSSLFHLCPSQTEGWGHYIVEALSTSAVVITVDAPPMNELVDASRGVLVPYSTTGMHHLAHTYDFDETVLAATIERVIAMSDVECAQIGDMARAWYLTNKAKFQSGIVRAVKHLRADCDTLEHTRTSIG